jgi:2-polyprenyl-3-methyl-5-hydroxy-6-metoxy-1,4-benzoquinol methylase
MLRSERSDEVFSHRNRNTGTIVREAYLVKGGAYARIQINLKSSFILIFMRDYVEANKRAFSTLAPQYNERWRTYLGHQEEVLKPFEDRLKDEFEGQIRVLDIGCGVGLDLYILSQHGFNVHGLDICPEMVGYAQQNVPEAQVVVGDFLNGTLDDVFNGVVMDAFLHLFPERDVPLVFDKVKSVLHHQGYGLICTTKSDESKEGHFLKCDYRGKTRRFRKFWREDELRKSLQDNGFEICDFYEDHEETFDKVWMNVVFRQVQG